MLPETLPVSNADAAPGHEPHAGAWACVPFSVPDDYRLAARELPNTLANTNYPRGTVPS